MLIAFWEWPLLLDPPLTLFDEPSAGMGLRSSDSLVFELFADSFFKFSEELVLEFSAAVFWELLALELLACDVESSSSFS